MEINQNEYMVPQCKVKVGDLELNSGNDSKYYIEQVNVQLSTGSQSNSADVTIIADYDIKNAQIGGGLLSKLSIGKKVKIEMGYKLTTEVFMGYVNTMDMSFSEGGVTVSFSCLDVRGLLMGNTSWENYPNEKIEDIVNRILNPFREYIKNVKVDVGSEADKEYPHSKYNIDDFRYLSYLASITNCSFYVTATDFMFVKKVTEMPLPESSYKWQQDIISFGRKVDLSEQIGLVRVWGLSPYDPVPFMAEAYPPKGHGKTAVQINPDISKKESNFISYFVRNQQETEDFAKSMMFETALKICTGSAQVLGNEKLKVGSSVNIDGLDPNVNGDYFINSLTHSYGLGGFMTTIGFAKPGA